MTAIPAKAPNMNLNDKVLSIVISAYNEEGNIRELYRQLREALAKLPLKGVEIIFVDDGSRDKTLFCCHDLQLHDPDIKIVRLIRNYGHEIAMDAGMDYASGDAVIFMDADLQHPPACILEMVGLWQKGHEIVLTKRTDNLDTSALYKFAAKTFYRVLNILSDVEIPENTPDFRLIDRKYINYLQAFNERDSLFRGVLSLIVSYENIACVEFVAPQRLAGDSKYNLSRHIKLAVNSILQFSVKPLYLSMWLAVLSAFFATGLGIYVIIEYFVLNHPTPGYATIMTVLGFMSSVILFVLAIMGVYIGKIHIETKKRPIYLAELIERPEKNAEKDY